MSATTFSPTCPSWCDSGHPPRVEADGYVHHIRTIIVGDVTMDLEQLTEWEYKEEAGQWLVTTHPPRGVLGAEFDNAEPLDVTDLRTRRDAIDAAIQELTVLVDEFTGAGANNQATAADLPDLKPLGITAARRSSKPMKAYRDPVSQKMLIEIGQVYVWRDGRVRVQSRCDAPDRAMDVLVSTALDCHERDLHRRDKWTYYRATKSDPIGVWSATILASCEFGAAPFEDYAVALYPVAAPGRAPDRQRHPIPEAPSFA